ncbi:MULTISPECIES: ACT domain-containing protein [unclassified Streptomyces]|uniref:ACT domain-containing protein n=1 Tax=unclassified Streptomyces TaxID=2593676 RepID=UPI00386C17D3|nr:hypothetical protein OG331_00860 [Streptomyces sp. NBC_01017]WSV35263.1 hypothetical protein OG331_51110 [Streptomyces sp. NBC_01017]
MERHRLSVLFCDRPRALARITSLLAQRGYLVCELDTEATGSARIRRASFVVEREQVQSLQVVAQLEKQVDVLRVDLLSAADAQSESLGLIAEAAGADRSAGRDVCAKVGRDRAKLFIERPTPITASSQRNRRTVTKDRG